MPSISQGNPALRWILLCLAPLFSLGCSATVDPPPNPLHPVAAYVADYGRHSSIFLPVEKTGYVEYSFGDWNFYAMNRTSACNALEALFFSRGSALGRRYSPRAANGGPIPLGMPRLFAVCVSREASNRVMRALEAKWNAHRSTRVYNADDDTEFVKDDRPYGWSADCNVATAELLRELGCQVHGATYFSHFKLSDDAWGRMEYCE